MMNKLVKSSKSFQKSKKQSPHLEISVQVGCGLMCSYCPQTQYIKKYKEIYGKRHKLSYDTFLLVVDNIPLNTVIHWTGFTEPFACKDFPLIVSHLFDLGYKQIISTTLYGLKENQQFFIDNLELFSEGINLHLPDSSKLMKGKFTDEYFKYVESVFIRLLEINSKYFDLFLIGDEFHPEITQLIEKYLNNLPSDKIVKAKYLNTRNGSINVESFGLMTSNSVSNKGSYYCSYRRLNQGVLLPNGRISLCCQDYDLNMILGSLVENNLLDIYNVIQNDKEMSSDFVNGKFYPCVECEHYKPLSEMLTTDRK